jgi:hypothetical protein
MHKSASTYKEIIFSTFSNQFSTLHLHLFNFLYEFETYAHVGLRDGGPVFRAPPCTLNRHFKYYFILIPRRNIEFKGKNIGIK